MTLLEHPEDGWFVTEDRRRETPNRYVGGFDRHHVLPVELVVYHYTASTLSSALAWLISPAASASAHFIVDKIGDVWQLASVKDRTWHAGGLTSSWRGKSRVNSRSIGIELENWGPVSIQDKKRTERGGVEVITAGRKIEVADVFTDINGLTWDAYTDAQMVSTGLITAMLVRLFPRLIEPGRFALGPPDGRFIGHHDVDPKRKRDPGPAVPWQRILSNAMIA